MTVEKLWLLALVLASVGLDLQVELRESAALVSSNGLLAALVRQALPLETGETEEPVSKAREPEPSQTLMTETPAGAPTPLSPPKSESVVCLESRLIAALVSLLRAVATKALLRLPREMVLLS